MGPLTNVESQSDATTKMLGSYNNAAEYVSRPSTNLGVSIRTYDSPNVKEVVASGQEATATS